MRTTDSGKKMRQGFVPVSSSTTPSATPSPRSSFEERARGEASPAVPETDEPARQKKEQKKGQKKAQKKKHKKRVSPVVPEDGAATEDDKKKAEEKPETTEVTKVTEVTEVTKKAEDEKKPDEAPKDQ